MLVFFFFKQKTAYEMRISDWSSDVCSSDLVGHATVRSPPGQSRYRVKFYPSAARLEWHAVQEWGGAASFLYPQRGAVDPNSSPVATRRAGAPSSTRPGRSSRDRCGPDAIAAPCAQAWHPPPAWGDRLRDVPPRPAESDAQ